VLWLPASVALAGNLELNFGGTRGPFWLGLSLVVAASAVGTLLWAAAPRPRPDGMDLPVFHLAFPVRDLAAAKAFYCGVLGARVGRDNEAWADIVLFGHQLTLHQRPDEVPGPDQRGVRHFGAILPWPEWEALAKDIQAAGAGFVSPPTVSFAGTPREQGKLLLCDPSDNLIELKAYRNMHAAFGTGPMDPIRTVAAVIENETGKVLLVRKRSSTIFIQPGGKTEPGEDPIAALARELREELGVELDVGSVRRLGEFEDVAVNEPGRRVRAEAFKCAVVGNPTPCAEIEEFAWVDPAGPYAVPVAPLSATHILPCFVRSTPRGESGTAP